MTARWLFILFYCLATVGAAARITTDDPERSAHVVVIQAAGWPVMLGWKAAAP